MKEWEAFKMESEWAIRKNDSAITNFKASEKKMPIMIKKSPYRRKIMMP
jgi:hypothetical protein